MGRRAALILTALVFLIVGAMAAYFAMSIPNDIRAEALLRSARNDLRDGKREPARQSLETIVRSYPRTDAAATATVALIGLIVADQKASQQAMQSQLDAMQRESAAAGRRLTQLETEAAKPPPAPVAPPVQVSRPAPPKPRPAAPARKTTRPATRKRG